MTSGSQSARNGPFTYSIDVANALETLDHEHMVALSEMYLSWVIDGQVEGERGAQVTLWSIDYEAIAEFAGPDWRATAPQPRVDAVRFVADQAINAVKRATWGPSAPDRRGRFVV